MALAKLALIEKGLEAGTLTFEKARQLFRETWAATQWDYDIEKVFWRSMYGIGFAVLGKIIYGIWYQIQLLTKRPDLAGAEWMETWATNPLFSGFWMGWGLTNWILENLVPGWAEMKEAERKKRREEIRKELGVPPILDEIMGDKFPLVLAAIPALFAFLEWRDYKRRREIF